MQLLNEAFLSPWVQGLALLLLCGAYLQGAFDKLRDFPGAVAEMRQVGLAPAAPFAAAALGLELLASLMIVFGVHRWLGALALAGFTLLASLLSNRFWRLPKATPERAGGARTFFEHGGLVGAMLLVAWHDLGGRDVF